MLKKKTNLVDGSMYNEKNSILHFRFYFFSFLSYGNYARVLTSTINREYIMRIPTNSNFTKEMSKRLQRIINPQTTLEELQNLQEQSDLSYNPIYINPVDSYLANQVIKLEKANATIKTSVQDARAIRSTEPKRKGFVKKIVQDKRAEEEFAV